MRAQLFYKKAKKVIQNRDIEENKRLAHVRHLFLESLGPSYHCASVQDLFDWELNYVWSRQETLYTLLERLQRIVEFLNNEGDDINFEKEESQLLLSLIDASAGNLPIKELSALMQVMLSKGLL